MSSHDRYYHAGRHQGASGSLTSSSSRRGGYPSRGPSWGPRGDFRSSYRDFNRSGPWNRFTSASSSVPPPPPPPLGDLIETIHRKDLEEMFDPSTYCGITDAKLAASYNWMTSSGPKIMIPGKPPLWTPRKGPYQIREDDGTYYRDANAAAYSDHPTEAAVVSVMEMNAPASHSGIDLFACGSTLGNLLRFVKGSDSSFRMLVEVIGTTVHLIRRENSPKEQLVGVRGYGHTFPEENTIWEKDVAGSDSHQRIIKYRFNGLDIMVRAKGDGYLKLIEKVEHVESSSTVTGDDASQDPHASLDDGMEALKLDTETQEQISEGLQTVKGGQIIPQDAVFDIKTRSMKKQQRDILGEELPRLWVAQIKRLVLAYHTLGSFDDVEVQDVSANVLAWESDNQETVQRFARLLHRIIESRLEAGPEDKVELVRHEGSDALEIRKRLPDAGTPFSVGTYRRWAGWLNGVAYEEADSGESKLERENRDSHGDSEDDESEDFTACDEDCGYCGRCATSLL